MKKNPNFAGIYISDDVRKILFFGRVREVVVAEEASLKKAPEEYADFQTNRKIIEFHDEELYKLEDPIPFEEKVLYPPVRYVNLSSFKEAKTMDDIL